MNKKVLVIPLIVFVLAMLEAPVMALGSMKALEVGNNPNLTPTVSGYDGVINTRGNAGGGIIFVLEGNGIWVKWNWFSASAGKGKFKNAIEAGPPDVPIFDIMDADAEAFVNGEETQLENKWIFMSPEGSGKQIPSPIGTHGLVFWMYWGLAGGIGAMPDSAIFAAEHAAEFPDGVFWKYNFIKMD